MCHNVHVEVLGQLAGVSLSLFTNVGPEDQT